MCYDGEAADRKDRPLKGVGEMGGSAVMRLLTDIRFGTESYPDKVARRLRTVNFGTRIAASGHALFFVVTLAYFARFWWLLLVHTVMMLLFVIGGLRWPTFQHQQRQSISAGAFADIELMRPPS